MAENSDMQPGPPRNGGARFDHLLRSFVGAVVSGSTRTVFRRTPLNFDRAHGVETQGDEGLRALVTPVYDAGGRTRYEPITVKHFKFALEQVPAPIERWSFMDIGSGKGRAVLLAMGHPFRQIAGVELDPALHAAAEANLRRYHGPRRCEQVVLRCEDATTAALLPGDLVIFFYNSFNGLLLHRFLDHLEAALRENPRRRLLLLYSNPTEREQVDARPAFRCCFDGTSPYDLIWWGCRRLVAYSAGQEG